MVLSKKYCFDPKQNRVKPELEKMGTLKKNGDPMGTQNLKKVPMGTRVPKWGPTWEQCTPCRQMTNGQKNIHPCIKTEHWKIADNKAGDKKGTE